MQRVTRAYSKFDNVSESIIQIKITQLVFEISGKS